MKMRLSLLFIFSSIFLRAQVSDTTVLLPSVTVLYQEDEALILWRKLLENWPMYKNQSYNSAKIYSRQSTASNEIEFEQVSNVYHNEDTWYQEVVGFKDYENPIADFEDNVEFQASFSFDGDFDFNQGAEKGTFSKFPYSRFENLCINPLNRIIDVEFAPSQIAGVMDRNAMNHYEFKIIAKWESDSS